MHFSDPMLQRILDSWRQATDARERSTADNLWFEERLSQSRFATFEAAVNGVASSTDLRNRQSDYWNEFVVVDQDIPHTFLRNLEPADLGTLQETQKIVRLESITRPLESSGLTFVQLSNAVRDNDAAVINAFLRAWNDKRDWRPAFAAFEDELLDTLANGDWAQRMRDRLGLAHFDCRTGPIQVALMKYSVSEVRNAANIQDGACAITAPTVLDSGPWPFFFPAPRDLSCGRTMPLVAVADDRDLLAEVLHFRISYRREHIVRLGELREPPEAFDLRVLRNHHLLAVRVASGRDDFGEEIDISSEETV